MDQVLITIPAKNEEATIASVVAGFRDELLRLGVASQIQVVDDHSTDGTRQVAQSMGVEVHSVVDGSGLAAAFRKEMECAARSTATFVIHVDADGQHPSKFVGELLDKLYAGYDLVLGTRLHVKPSGMSELRFTANKFLSSVVSSLAGCPISDSQTGYRAMNQSTISLVKINSSFTYTQEQIIRAGRAGLKIIEVPIDVLPRCSTNSRLAQDPLVSPLKVLQTT